MLIVTVVLHRNCNWKYDNLYSTVGCKPLLGCFTRMFTDIAITNVRDYRSSRPTVSTAFVSRKGCGFQSSCRKTVPSAWTSNLKNPIVQFSLGSRHGNI